MAPDVSRWLSRAAELRKLADGTTEGRVAKHLLGVARTYEQLADRVAHSRLSRGRNRRSMPSVPDNPRENA